MKKYAEVDKTNTPIIVVTFTGNNADNNNFPFYLNEVKQCYQEKKRIAIIFDATKAVFPGLSFQKMQGDWLKENTELMQNYCAGTAYVIPNIIIRNVLKTIFAFQKQPVPYFVCDDVPAGNAWIEKQLVN